MTGRTQRNVVEVVLDSDADADALVVGFRRDGEFFELASRAPPATVRLFEHGDVEGRARER